MRCNRNKKIIASCARRIFAVSIAAIFGRPLVLGHGPNDFAIDWFPIEGGGITFASGGDSELGSTIGQPSA